MKIELLPASKSKTINWASGTSTELYIFPSTGDFQTRDFTFRISTATVEAEETTFSNFPAILRTLMVLEGNLTLIHEGRYTKELKTFDQDTFMGDWVTKSRGKVRDFNLMCKNGASGFVEHLVVSEAENRRVSLKGDLDFVYVLDGLFGVQDIQLRKGDSLLVEREEESNLTISCLHSGNLILVHVDK